MIRRYVVVVHSFAPSPVTLLLLRLDAFMLSIPASSNRSELEHWGARAAALHEVLDGALPPDAEAGVSDPWPHRLEPCDECVDLSPIDGGDPQVGRQQPVAPAGREGGRGRDDVGPLGLDVQGQAVRRVR